MNFDVVTFGSAFVDVYLAVPEVVKGSKLNVDKMVLTTGGGATNTAAGFERLGLQTASACCVGRDHWGLFIRQEMKKEGISSLYIQQSESPTSYSTILVGEGGERTVLVFRGASNELAWNKIEWEKLDPKWFYVSSLGGNFNLLTKIIRWAEKKGIRVAFNPGSKEIEAGRTLKAFLPKIEVLLLNLQEAVKLTDNVSRLGAKLVAITEGKKGASVVVGKKKIKLTACQAKTIEETGAGDAFGCGLVGGLIKGFDLEQALKLGLANGASVTEHFGPKKGLLFEPEIKTWMKKLQ